MPELPDLALYLEALDARLVGQKLTRVELVSAFVLRTAVPPIEVLVGTRVTGLRRIGKRIVLAFEHERFLVLHLMVAGRLHWAAGVPRRGGAKSLAKLEFETGTLTLTEAGTKRRASIHVIQGEAALAAMDPGGIEPLEATREAFARALTASNRSLKRALTDPAIVSGIGNAYSDEILHRAQLPPFKRTQDLDEAEMDRLYAATRSTLSDWIRWLREAEGSGFPGRVTAFRKGMAVHGRYKEPCPVCGAPVQRVVYAENEMNYCARCQTEGRIYADRALSQVLHDDFARHLDE
ncbi:MAG TPA: DNA-formamidopyrimidine glycosylase family protein [Xanthomonadales bacterium]|nr:DNA-formamidopyrimidine glycosylase family protein [Xanthomonadales bacterium]